MKGLYLILILCSIPIFIFAQQSFVSGDPKLAYWEIGNKKNTIIVLHGGPCVEHQYLRPEFDLLQKHCRVIYFDQRGCGLSDPAPTYNWMDHVGDIKRLIDSLSENNKVFLAGSSWGSLLSLLYALNYPQDLHGLILSGLVDWRGMGYTIEEYNKITYGYSEDSKDTIYVRPKQDDKNENKRLAIWNNGRRATEPMVSMKTAPTLDSLRFIQLPVLIFSEDSSCVFSKEINKYLEVLPNTITRTITGSCHDTWLANPKLFFKHANKFVRQVVKKKELRIN